MNLISTDGYTVVTFSTYIRTSSQQTGYCFITTFCLFRFFFHRFVSNAQFYSHFSLNYSTAITTIVHPYPPIRMTYIYESIFFRLTLMVLVFVFVSLLHFATFAVARRNRYLRALFTTINKNFKFDSNYDYFIISILFLFLLFFFSNFVLF